MPIGRNTVIRKETKVLDTTVRRQHIEKVITIIGYVRVSELADRLGVSEVTIRKDLSALELDGRLVRTWGGARMFKEEDILHEVDRALSTIGPKRIPLAFAADFISEDDVVYLDHGDRCVLLARELMHNNIDVITPSFRVIEELINAPAVRLHTPGGSYSREKGIFDGTIPKDVLSSMHIDICFIQISDYHHRSSKEKKLIEQVMERSRKRILLIREEDFSLKVHEVLQKYQPEYLII